MKATWADANSFKNKFKPAFTIVEFPITKTGMLIELATGSKVASTPEEAIEFIQREGEYK